MVILAILGLMIVPLGCAWFLFDGLRNGVVRAKGGSYARAEEPTLFWMTMALYAGLLVWFFYLLGPILWEVTAGLVEFGLDPMNQS